MFGIGLQKLLLLAAILGAVWYGWKWIGRMKQERDAMLKARQDALRRDGGRPATGPDTEDMVACPTCGTFVATRTPTRCGRGNCPY